MKIQIPWLEHPHEAELIVDGTLPAEGDTTAVMAFVFKGENILLAQVHSRGWDIPGGHKERGETMEETVRRELLEECGAEPILLGPLGCLNITIYGEECPKGYIYPFPYSSIAFYWGVVGDIGTPSASMEVGMPKFFTPEQATQLECIKGYQRPLYDAALERAKVVAQALEENA